MSIIKNGRINIWNAVKKQFEVVHPETETARITDFADGIVQKLALTSAMTAVTALQTNSWFGQLLKMVLTASGVKYNIAQNGYVCLGSFFGGLIIQWGTVHNADGNINTYVTLPISATQNIGVLNVSDEGTNDAVWNGNLVNSNTILVTAWRSNGISLKGISAKWLLVCF